MAPMYQYRCDKCEHVTSRLQKYDAERILDCEECGEVAERAIIGPPIIRFKGKGWASTRGVIKDND